MLRAYMNQLGRRWLSVASRFNRRSRAAQHEGLRFARHRSRRFTYPRRDAAHWPNSSCSAAIHRGRRDKVSRQDHANLRRAGDFVVTNAPEIDAERTDVERLAEAIRRSPGQSRHYVIEASGVAQRRACVLLERHSGQLWHSRRGPHNSMLFFPGGISPEDRVEGGSGA